MDGNKQKKYLDEKQQYVQMSRIFQPINIKVATGTVMVRADHTPPKNREEQYKMYTIPGNINRAHGWQQTAKIFG